MSFISTREVLLNGEWHINLARQFFAESVKAQEWQQAGEVFKILVDRHPENVQLCSLYIALLLKQGKPSSAMHHIRKMVARPDCDETLIDAALAVRKQTLAAKEALAVEPEISLCMIVRDESKHIGRCLFHHKSLVDEIILVDTGSKDRTKDIALIYDARIFDFPWQNDFAAARNYSLSKATGRWILILDADERIASEDFTCLRKLAKGHGTKKAAYSMVTRNYCHKANTIGWQPNEGSYKKYERGLGWFPSNKVRLFKRDASIVFDFPVHERVEPSLKAKAIQIRACNIPVHHYGHLDEILNPQKACAYYRLGCAKLDAFKNNPEGLRELAVQAGQMERWEEAIGLWQRLLNLVPKYAEGHINLSGAHWQLGDYNHSLSSAQKALDLDPGLKEAHFNAAISHLMLRQLKQAKTILQDLLKSMPEYMAARFMLTAVHTAAGDLNGATHELGRLGETMDKRVVSVAMEDLSRRFEQSGSKDFARALDMARTKVLGAVDR
jgi:glycosyltransferase involved in cell wall biosynthesis